MYLHGFASSARSTKASFFAERLKEHGVTLARPDFNEPEFERMTMTRMLGQLDEAMSALGAPATLVGSSLGGALAVLAASRFGARVDRLVLLAPAVMFAKPGHHLLPPDGIATWRKRGALPFFHFGYNEERLLGFSFYEDSLTHDAFGARFDQPALVFQGVHDAVVDHRTVEAFAKTRPNVTLTLVNDDHQLIATLPRIWRDVEAFLGLGIRN